MRTVPRAHPGVARSRADCDPFRACRSCELRASTCPYGIDGPTRPRRDSWLMQPPRDRSVTLVQRRHVDLVRVASAVCRCR
ncbi:putative leader peptide [Streptomyces sp. NPDC059593]|uniref:putative leader peptide n=1 Tax=Streptomyces sp. NPDC059593 TaxID=3346878 RepID=UPI0036C8A638